MLEEIEKIISKINTHWNKDEIIRFLYVKIAPFFRRDINYFLQDAEEQLRLYNAGFSFNGADIVCITLCDFYIEIFNNLGIRAINVPVTNAKIPLHALLVEGENGWYYIDPLSDLFYNQYGIKPVHYGVIPKRAKEILADSSYPKVSMLDLEYLSAIDEMLGFEYLDEYFNALHNKFSQKNVACDFLNVDKQDRLTLIDRKLRFANSNLINLGQVYGILERVRMYFFIIRKVFDKTEKRMTKIELDGDLNITIITHDVSNPNHVLGEYVEVKKDSCFSLVRIK